MMHAKKLIRYSTIILTLLLFAFGCAMGHYGRITREYASTSGLSIETLKENWQDYDVYYAGIAEDNPRGIMFDPKSDDRKLTGDRWVRLEDKERVSRVILWLENMGPELRPYLFRIIGPDQQVYGYIYTQTNNVVSRAVDDKTLFVFDLELPETVRSSYSEI